MSVLPLWFEYLLLVLLIILFALSIANSVYYGRAINDPNPNPPISHNTAHLMMWINIILTLASLAGIIILIIRLVLVREDSPIVIYRGNTKRARESQRKLDAGLACDSFASESDKRICVLNQKHWSEKSKMGLECEKIRSLRGDSDPIYRKCLANANT